jgi:hypothetical protein
VRADRVVCSVPDSCAKGAFRAVSLVSAPKPEGRVLLENGFPPRDNDARAVNRVRPLLIVPLKAFLGTHTGIATDQPRRHTRRAQGYTSSA